MTFEQLHHLVESAADARLSATHPVYELRGGFLPFSKRSRSLRQRQIRVLAAVRQLGWPAFLRIAKTPREGRLPDSWGHAARDTWGVPREVESPRLLESILAPGSWHVYLALEAVDPTVLPDLFRGSLVEAFSVVEGMGIPVLIDASSGNSEWRVLLQPAAVARRAAA